MNGFLSSGTSKKNLLMKLIKIFDVTVPANVTDCAPKKICCWIPALCCLTTECWHCPPSLIGTSFHCSGSSSQCILLTSGKYLMKCWVFSYFLKLIFLIIISWVPESELTNNLYQAAWNNSRSTLTQTNTTEITLIPHVLTSGKQK